MTTAAGDDRATPARIELLRAAQWRAARYGMTEELVELTAGTPRLVAAWDLARSLAEYTAEALEDAGDADRVHALFDRIRQLGTGAERQRAGARDGATAGRSTRARCPVDRSG